VSAPIYNSSGPCRAASIARLGALGQYRRKQILARPPNKGWKRAFDDPIVLPNGRMIVTLLDAGDYNSGLASAPVCPQTWQVNLGSRSESLIKNGPNTGASWGRLSSDASGGRHPVVPSQVLLGLPSF
jgi:hypothetical protein